MSVHKDSDKQIKVIAGKFQKAEGPIKKHNVEPVYFDVELKKDKEFNLKDKPKETFIGKGIDNKGLLIAQNLKDQRIVKFSSGEVSLKLKK